MSGYYSTTDGRHIFRLLDGERTNDIPPRPMDSLDAEVRDGEIWVKFQKFRAGIHERQAV